YGSTWPGASSSGSGGEGPGDLAGFSGFFSWVGALVSWRADSRVGGEPPRRGSRASRLVPLSRPVVPSCSAPASRPVPCSGPVLAGGAEAGADCSGVCTTAGGRTCGPDVSAGRCDHQAAPPVTRAVTSAPTPSASSGCLRLPGPASAGIAPE